MGCPARHASCASATAFSVFKSKFLCFVRQLFVYYSFRKPVDQQFLDYSDIPLVRHKVWSVVSSLSPCVNDFRVTPALGLACCWQCFKLHGPEVTWYRRSGEVLGCFRFLSFFPFPSLSLSWVLVLPRPVLQHDAASLC